MKEVISLLLVLSAGISGSAVQAVDDRPSWCPSGYQCIKNEELTRDTIYKITLEQEIVRLKGRMRRFGCVLGGGFGKTWAVTDDLEVKGVLGPNLGVTCGYRF